MFLPKIAIPVTEKYCSVANYENALNCLGALPVRVFPGEDIGQFSGLLLPGGIDVDPKFYHQENTACGSIDLELDQMQFDYIDRFLAKGLPVFGVCRGHQVVNVYFGGTLIQNIETCTMHKWRPDGDSIHTTVAEADGFIGRLYGTKLTTNSAHHQGVELPGEGLRIVQTSDTDGICEALAHETLPVRTVQWHPERMCFLKKRSDTVSGKPVLEYFVNACKNGGYEF